MKSGQWKYRLAAVITAVIMLAGCGTGDKPSVVPTTPLLLRLSSSHRFKLNNG
jgi:hypothetical protein